MSAILKDAGDGLISGNGFRPATEHDLEAIMLIEQAAYDFPWSKKLLKDCIESNYYFCLMLEHNDIIGYGIMSCVLDEAHILNLCIDPQWQGKGLGKQLLFHLMDMARKNRASTVFLEVRFSNAVAQELYETNGFNQLGMRKDYYPNGKHREDAIIYAKAL